MEVDPEKKLQITRTDSSVEITVGEGDGPTKNEVPEEDEAKEESVCACEPWSGIENSCCFRPLTKLQLCIIAIVAIVTLILALFVIIILVGVIASHAYRLRDLEVQVKLLVASSAHYQALGMNLTRNATKFEAQMRATINAAVNQFNIIYIQTLSLFAMKDQLESKVDQLVNRTNSFDAQLSLLAGQVRSLRSDGSAMALSVSGQVASSDDVSLEEAPESDGKCETVIICVRFVERSDYQCATSIPMSMEDFLEMKKKYLQILNLDYHYHCSDSECVKEECQGKVVM